MIVENIRKVKKAIPFIESRMNIKISFLGNSIAINGNEFDEFLTEKIISAVDFGFDVEDAFLLKNETFVFETVEIKKHTRRKNLKEVRARLIGTEGKAKRNIEGLTGAILFVRDSRVGIIVDAAHLDAAVQGIISIIQGSKHSNVFSYLEKQNAERKKFDKGDFGLKDSVKKFEDEI